MKELRVFVSSVQKELENERIGVLSLINTDPFLNQHCEPILYELEPASPEESIKGCLKSLQACDIYLVIIWKEYGHIVEGLSMTHHEYRCAKGVKMPILVYMKGPAELKREPGTVKFVQEVQKDGFKYRRFGNFLELQNEVRASLVRLLEEKFRIKPSADENKIAEQTIKATSDFENQALKRLIWEDLDHELARRLIASAEKIELPAIPEKELIRKLLIRGLLWTDMEFGTYYATAAGIALLGIDPSAVFPQCRFLADAYRGPEMDGNPMDHEDITEPLPIAIEKVIAFIERNTRHPIRVVGLNRVRSDEYPTEAIREALVNAGAHRDYEDRGRKILVEKFSDRIVISSPGLPPPPLTLSKLRSGKYKPCSRNPLLAQCLSFFHRIEERGSGFRRMREAMIDHGLDKPEIDSYTGYFQVIFWGPGDDIDKIRVSAKDVGQIIPPSIEAKLNDRQKKTIAHILKEGFVTSGWCKKQFQVVYDTVNRDLTELMKLKVVERTGKGRSTRYVLKEKQ
ncbi:MAG: DUF4062 domain-containing protein [Desulfobacterales bacterium]|nr:DUF4062 domain-containing protein [Desulfobacterales bacterium]